MSWTAETIELKSVVSPPANLYSKWRELSTRLNKSYINPLLGVLTLVWVSSKSSTMPSLLAISTASSSLSSLKPSKLMMCCKILFAIIWHCAEDSTETVMRWLRSAGSRMAFFNLWFVGHYSTRLIKSSSVFTTLKRAISEKPTISWFCLFFWFCLTGISLNSSEGRF